LAPVQLIRIEGGGHEWPNFLPHPEDREWLGHMSRDYDASERIWQFFARFRRAPGPGDVQTEGKRTGKTRRWEQIGGQCPIETFGDVLGPDLAS
jgi:hypothetical protein